MFSGVAVGTFKMKATRFVLTALY